MGRALVAAGALLGFVGVAAGAFGGHALRSRLTEDRLASFRTAAEYQLWHALATIMAGLVATQWQSGWAAAGGWLFVVGVVLFSGSLYALALTGRRRFGAVTPIGGLSLLAGWACVALGAFVA